MGKKAKFKQIRRIASAMPVINTRHIQGNVVTGGELIDKGIKEVKGNPVEYEKNYKEKKVVPSPLNHKRKMKKLYYMNGMNGVRMYMDAVKQYSQKKLAGK